MAPAVSAAVTTFTYHWLALKLATSAAVMLASCTDQWPESVLSWLSATSCGPVAAAAAVFTEAAVASATPVSCTCTVRVLALESTVTAAIPEALMLTGGTSWLPLSVPYTSVTLPGVIWPRISPAGFAAELASTYRPPCVGGERDEARSAIAGEGLIDRHRTRRDATHRDLAAHRAAGQLHGETCRSRRTRRRHREHLSRPHRDREGRIVVHADRDGRRACRLTLAVGHRGSQRMRAIAHRGAVPAHRIRSRARTADTCAVDQKLDRRHAGTGRSGSRAGRDGEIQRGVRCGHTDGRRRTGAAVLRTGHRGCAATAAAAAGTSATAGGEDHGEC